MPHQLQPEWAADPVDNANGRMPSRVNLGRMPRPRPLPEALGPRFSVQAALAKGVKRGRLRSSDLSTDFRGVRSTSAMPPFLLDDPFERQAMERRVRARRYAPRLRADQFYSHDTAIALLAGPQPLAFTDDDEVATGSALLIDVCTMGAGTPVRAQGVKAHRARPSNTEVREIAGLRVASPATAWAQVGATWSLLDLVALGDFLCRVWRPGPGRTDVGTAPFATVADLHAALMGGRRAGAPRLRAALELIREDSWSPRESKIRCHLVFAGLPEPALNHDVYDSDGRFLGCVDLAYPERKVAIEYQSLLHRDRYAADVERLAALRAAGWTVIEISSDLFARPEEFVARVRRALRG